MDSINATGDQLVEPSHPFQTLTQSTTTEPFAGVVLNEHIVMVLGPIHTGECVIR